MNVFYSWKFPLGQLRCAKTDHGLIAKLIEFFFISHYDSGWWEYTFGGGGRESTYTVHSNTGSIWRRWLLA